MSVYTAERILRSGWRVIGRRNPDNVELSVLDFRPPRHTKGCVCIILRKHNIMCCAKVCRRLSPNELAIIPSNWTDFIKLSEKQWTIICSLFQDE